MIYLLSITVQDMTIIESEFDVTADFSTFELCMDCKKPADYMHSNGLLVCGKCRKNYMGCPGCGMLFDELSGAMCDPCESRAKKVSNIKHIWYYLMRRSLNQVRKYVILSSE